jgi:hypothetical protein
MHVGEVERTSLVLIPAYMKEIVSAMKFPDTTLTAKILADITECRQRVRPTFATCWQQTKMSVVWVVEPTDTNPNIASQGGERPRSVPLWRIMFMEIKGESRKVGQAYWLLVGCLTI